MKSHSPIKPDYEVEYHLYFIHEETEDQRTKLFVQNHVASNVGVN